MRTSKFEIISLESFENVTITKCHFFLYLLLAKRDWQVKFQKLEISPLNELNEAKRKINLHEEDRGEEDAENRDGRCRYSFCAWRADLFDGD